MSHHRRLTAAGTGQYKQRPFSIFDRFLLLSIKSAQIHFSQLSSIFYAK